MSTGASAEFQLPDRFELVRKLGDGGMGVVYEAYDRKTNATVALKTLLRAGASAVYRFKKEFRALADVTHPNLVTLHELFSEGQTWFFTMELVDGTSFLSWVRPGLEPDQPTDEVSLPTVAVIDPALRRVDVRGPNDTEAEPPPPPPIRLPLDEPRLRHAMAQVAAGLQALHDAGKLHRDLKPSNVLVTGAGRAVILDFGLATDIDEESIARSHAGVMGTVAYLAPEIAAGSPATTASDWYAVGVMLYQALSGQLPYLGTPYQVLLAKQTEAPPPITALDPTAPADLVALAMELLAINPRDRPLGRDVARRLGAHALPALAPPLYGRGLLRTPLFGRSEHLAAMKGAFVAAKEKPVVVHLSGAPGMGKTALAQHFLSELEREGSAIVLSGRCFEAEALPFKAVDPLIDSLTRYLRRLSLVELEQLLPPDVESLVALFPVLERVDVIQRRLAPSKGKRRVDEREAFQALRHLYYQLARKRRVVCFLDDLQFADDDSARLLATLLSPPRPPPFLLIAAYPSGERDRHEILRVLRAPKAEAFLVREVLVGALSQSAAEEMARTILKGQTEPEDEDERPEEQVRTTMPAFPPAELRARARAIAREAEGHPLFVHELALDARHELQGGQSPGPASLEQVLRRRHHALPERQRRLLEILAVAGPLPRRVAQHAAGLEAKDAGAVHQLEILRLVRSRRDGPEEFLECENERVGATIAATLDQPQRVELHRRMAEAYRAQGGAPERILPHLEAAGLAPVSTEELAHVVIGREASLTNGDDDDETVATLARAAERRVRAEALAHQGRPEAAEVFLEAARLSTDPKEQRDLKRRAADVYLRSGRVELGLALLRPLLRGIGAELPRDTEAALAMLRIERSRLLVRGLEPADPPVVDPELRFEAEVAWTAAVGLTFVDVVASAIFTSRYLRLALDLGEPGLLARGLAMELGFLTSEAAPSSTRIHRVLEALKRRAKEASEPYVRGFAALGAGLAALHEGEWTQTVRCVENAEGILVRRKGGADWELNTARTFGLWAEAYRGRFLGLPERLSELITDAATRGDVYASTVLRLSGNATLIWLAADRPEQALAHLEATRREAVGPGYPLAHYWDLSSRVLLELYQNPGPSAWRLVSKEWPTLERSQVLRVQVIRAEALYLRARAALAAAGSAPSPRPLFAAARADAEQLDREGRRWTSSLAALLRGEINLGLGLSREADEAYREAETGFLAAGMQAHALVARMRVGQLLGRSGRGAIAEATQDLSALGVRSVDRFFGLLAPSPRR